MGCQPANQSDAPRAPLAVASPDNDQHRSGFSRAEPGAAGQGAEAEEDAGAEEEWFETAASDSVHCGDGELDPGELCDIAIEPGEEGACPREEDCEPLEPCTEPALVFRGCLTHCTVGAPIDC